MAKRKRLTPAQSGFLGGARPVLEAKAASLSPPIAQVAGEASARSALADLSGMVEDARAEGRLIRSLDLDSVQADYMLRDRLLAPQDEDMQVLIDSLRKRGQQTPIDVVDLGDGGFGLVSGLRRLTAMRLLYAEGVGSGRINARIISPQTGPDAYVSMVEENEIRAGLSYYERARIVVKAVEAGVFPDIRDALLTLYGNASRAKRSKIKSFISVVEALDGMLRFAPHISERFGLEIARALSEDAKMASRLRDALAGQHPASFEEEHKYLRQGLARSSLDHLASDSAKNQIDLHQKTDDLQTIENNNTDILNRYQNSTIPETTSGGPKNVTVHVVDEGRALMLKGLGVSDSLRRDLEAWLAARG